MYEIDRNGSLPASNYKIIHLKQGIPYNVSETRHSKYYPEGGVPNGTPPIG